MGEQLLKWIPSISKQDLPLVGQKSFSLSEIYKASYPTPPAFTITTQAISSILKLNQQEEKIKNILKKTNENNINDSVNSIQKIITNQSFPPALEKEILEAYDHFNVDLNDVKSAPGALAILKTAREPVFVAIKSSPLDNSPSQTIINVKGNEEILEKIKRCLAKSLSEKFIQNHLESKTKELILPAIIVQKMINSEITGRIYSKNPEENDESILVKSAFGQLITKEISPDSQTLSRDFEILLEKIERKKFALTRTASGESKTMSLEEDESKRRVLKTYEIKQLAEIALKLEEHFKSPQEISFALENDSLFILNSKSISKAKSQENKKEITPPEKTRTSLIPLLDPTLFEEKTKTLSPENVIIKLENLVSSLEKTPLQYKEENNLEEYTSKIKESLSKIKSSLPNTFLWIKLPNIQTTKNSGTLFYLGNPDILNSTLKAIKSLHESQTGLILPQVSEPKEISEIQKNLEKLKMKNFQIGASIETPASSILIKDICSSGISIASFDIKALAKLTLANQEEPNQSSWAVLKQISRVIRECKSQNIQTSVHSGNMSDTKILNFLIKQKIGSLAISPINLYNISKLVQQAELGEQIEPIDNKKEIEKELRELKKAETEPKKENIFD